MSKRELRVQLRQRRRDISPAERAAAAGRLQRVALAEGLLRRPERIGFYLPFDGEMSLVPLLNRALWLGKACYLPIVPPRFERRMRFSRITAKPRWYHNRFGIHEHWSPRPVQVRQLDLLLVPLVGFDLQGNRLGMGGGFYDATLAYLRQRRALRKPRIVGIAFECQKVERVPHDPWDFRLDAVLTERRLYRFHQV